MHLVIVKVFPIRSLHYACILHYLLKHRRIILSLPVSSFLSTLLVRASMNSLPACLPACPQTSTCSYERWDGLFSFFFFFVVILQGVFLSEPASTTALSKGGCALRQHNAGTAHVSTLIIYMSGSHRLLASCFYFQAIYTCVDGGKTSKQCNPMGGGLMPPRASSVEFL